MELSTIIPTPRMSPDNEITLIEIPTKKKNNSDTTNERGIVTDINSGVLKSLIKKKITKMTDSISKINLTEQSYRMLQHQILTNSLEAILKETADGLVVVSCQAPEGCPDTDVLRGFRSFSMSIFVTVLELLVMTGLGNEDNLIWYLYSFSDCFREATPPNATNSSAPRAFRIQDVVRSITGLEGEIKILVEEIKSSIYNPDVWCRHIPHFLEKFKDLVSDLGRLRLCTKPLPEP